VHYLHDPAVIIELTGRHNLMRYFWVSGQILRGWAMARQGAGGTGLELMWRSATERIATGATWWQTRYLCMLAETDLQHNRAEEGLVAVAETMELMKRTEEHMCQAELARIEDELRSLQGASASEAEGHFQWALRIARKQKANQVLCIAHITVEVFGRPERAGAPEKVICLFCSERLPRMNGTLQRIVRICFD
jgi:predicted ATPase